MTGTEFKRLAREKNVFLWEVAEVAGISEPTLTRWLRGTLSPERGERLTNALMTIVEKGA